MMYVGVEGIIVESALAGSTVVELDVVRLVVLISCVSIQGDPWLCQFIREFQPSPLSV